MFFNILNKLNNLPTDGKNASTLKKRYILFWLSSSYKNHNASDKNCFKTLSASICPLKVPIFHHRGQKLSIDFISIYKTTKVLAFSHHQKSDYRIFEIQLLKGSVMLLTLEVETNCNHGGTKPEVVWSLAPTIYTPAPTRHFPPKLRQPRSIGPSNGINIFSKQIKIFYYHKRARKQTRHIKF